MESWHTWFAWYPVTFDDVNYSRDHSETRAWLETVERCKKFGRHGSWWEYRKHDPILGLRNNDTQQGESV